MTLREHILSEVRREWQHVASQPDNDKVMGTPPDDITVFEHSQAELPHAQCSGSGTAIESLDRQQRSLAALFPAPPKQDQYRGAYWPHAYARFYVSADSSVAVLELVFGPRYGRGYRYAPGAHGGFTQSRVWVS
jgi:hypothetical protein